jgi:hypothetical protein
MQGWCGRTWGTGTGFSASMRHTATPGTLPAPANAGSTGMEAEDMVIKGWLRKTGSAGCDMHVFVTPVVM